MNDPRPVPPPPSYPPTVGISAPDEPRDAEEPGPERPAGADRLPHWRSRKPVLATPANEPDESEDELDEDSEDLVEDDQDDHPEEDETEDDEADAKSGPPRKGKAAKKKPGKRSSDRELRVIAFNGVAAGVGYGVGLVPVFGQWLPAAEQAATGMVGLVLAASGAVATWKLTGHPAVRPILPYVSVSRTLISVGAAELGRRLAPAAVAWINQNGAQWGLGASAVSLLLTAGGMCGGLWWFADRRARAWHWTARLVVRIPLASALLATALYAPGATS
ncbi:hypothetical protein [Streptomyces sp. NPDC019937]|uniref:hypothetical protein n=1 Tax=Streptomyces sp. NPDC019937 TaxID=3154787 RepID=UPI0033E6E455